MARGERPAGPAGGERVIRAVFDADTIRVYQAFGDAETSQQSHPEPHPHPDEAGVEVGSSVLSRA